MPDNSDGAADWASAVIDGEYSAAAATRATSAPMKLLLRHFITSEISRLLAVFHRCFARLVIGARATFGDARGRHFTDDVVHAVRGRLDHSGADHVRDGADTDNH